MEEAKGYKKIMVKGGEKEKDGKGYDEKRLKREYKRWRTGRDRRRI